MSVASQLHPLTARSIAVRRFWSADLAPPRADNEVMGTGHGQDQCRGRDRGLPMPAVDINRMVTPPRVDPPDHPDVSRAERTRSPSRGWDRSR